MKRQRYVGDSKGTVYEIVKGDFAGCPWTLVVCEDRPGLYSRLLADVVTSGLVGTAMTVPFTTQVVELLTQGRTKIIDASLSVENLDQCILVLDMDATYAVTDLLPKKDSAFVGGELFHRLDTRLRERTYLVSLKAPLDLEYYDRYPELTRIHVHPSLEEKKEEAAEGGGSTLAEGTKHLIRKFILQTKGELDHPTFAPVAEMRKVYEVYEVGRGDKLKMKRRVKTDAQGKAVEERCITKVTVSCDGSQPVDLKAMPGAHYLCMILQHSGQLLATSRLFSIVNPRDGDPREAEIDHEYDDTGRPVSGLSSPCVRTRRTQLLDRVTVDACCGELTAKLRKTLAFAADQIETRINEEANPGRKTKLRDMLHSMDATPGQQRNELLVQLKDADSDAATILNRLRSDGYLLSVRAVDGQWTVRATKRGKGGEGGERVQYPDSNSLRIAIDRFLKQEVQARLPRLYKHLRDSLEISDYSPSCQYKGTTGWSFGNVPDWCVPLERIAYGGSKPKVQHGPATGDVED